MLYDLFYLTLWLDAMGNKFIQVHIQSEPKWQEIIFITTVFDRKSGRVVVSVCCLHFTPTTICPPLSHSFMALLFSCLRIHVVNIFVSCIPKTILSWSYPVLSQNWPGKNEYSWMNQWVREGLNEWPSSGRRQCLQDMNLFLWDIMGHELLWKGECMGNRLVSEEMLVTYSIIYYHPIVYNVLFPKNRHQLGRRYLNLVQICVGCCPGLVNGAKVIS